VDIPHAYLLAAVDLGLVSRSGGWYTFAGDLQSFGSKKFRESDWRELFSPEVKDAIDAHLWGGCSNAGC